MLGYQTDVLPARVEAPVRETGCRIMVQHGEVIETVDAPELHVLDQSAADGPFTPRLPEGTVSLGCARSSIVPAPHDYEVLILGLPFYIIDTVESRRVGVLEVSQGQYRYRMLQGQLRDDESIAIQARLNEFQVRSRDR